MLLRSPLQTTPVGAELLKAQGQALYALGLEAARGPAQQVIECAEEPFVSQAATRRGKSPAWMSEKWTIRMVISGSARGGKGVRFRPWAIFRR
jgi:hypothetical protein